MEIVDFKHLFDAIKKVRNTLSYTSGIESTGWLCFRDGKLTTFDGASGTITKSPLKTEFCVAAKKFINMVESLVGKRGSFTFEEGWLHVQSESYQTKIPLLDERDFADIRPKNPEAYCLADNLAKAMKAAQGTMTKDTKTTSDRLLHGVGFRGSYAYSTDRKRVTRAALNSPVEHPVSIGKIAVDQLVRLGQPNYLFHEGTNIGAVYKEQKTLVVTRSLEELFPFEQMDQMFFDPSDRKVVVPVPEDLIEAVDRVQALVDDDESRLLLKAEPDKLYLKSLATESGETRDELHFPHGVEFEIKVKAQLFKQTLKRMKPSQIDLTDVVCGDSTMLFFYGDGFETAFATMV